MNSRPAASPARRCPDVASIHPSSRYARLRIVRIPHKSGRLVEATPFLIRTLPQDPEREQVYFSQAGDTVDGISWRVYGTPYLWHLIAERNPELSWPPDLTSDLPVVIPPRELGELGS